MSYSISNEPTWGSSPLLIPFCSLSCSSIPSQASLLHGIRDSSPWKRPQGAPNSCSAGLDLSLLTTCSVIFPFQTIFLFSLIEYLLVLNKEFACSVGDLGLIPESEGPLEANGNLLQFSFLENPIGRGALWVIIHGVTKNWTWLSNFHFFTTILQKIFFYFMMWKLRLRIQWSALIQVWFL